MPGKKLTETTKRIIIFVIGCIALRVIFEKIQKKTENKYSTIIKILMILPVLGLTYITWIKPVKYFGSFSDFIILTTPFLRNLQGAFFFIIAYLSIISDITENNKLTN